MPNKYCLTHEVVLAQAWKKSHQFIRSTSWHADTFELDRSAIALESKLKDWIKDLEDENFTFEPLKLIPSPKTMKWSFTPPGDEACLKKNFTFEDLDTYTWEPVKDPSGEVLLPPLRPLAHVSIRDQSLMTMLMMCIANKVETEQGDSKTKFEDVHENGVVNYGNRLYSQDIDGKAEFNWGNSNVYSQYFTDYRQFLARSAHFAYEEAQTKVKSERIYEVHLDLEKFYDKVDRAKLVEVIIKLSKEETIDPVFKRLLTQFQNWAWEDGAEEKYIEVCTKEGEAFIPKGIPQGLVAGGFLANIYLLEFDQWLGNKIGTSVHDKIRLVDYCRYVDDMRLIIVGNKDSEGSIREFIKEILKPKLEEIGLSFNDGKTKVDVFRSKVSILSSKLNAIQSKISGPLSNNEIDEQLGHIEGLIGFAEALNTNTQSENNNNPLAIIEGPLVDVREDTILRFSANKIHKLLGQKRSLVSQDVNDEGQIIPGNWDYLQERMARKFIACWSKDPSLIVMLKKGLELFPDSRILKPVIDQLSIVRQRDCGKQVAVAEYCLCEIFRHSATVIHNKNRFVLPAHADVDDYFNSLLGLADSFVDGEELINDYLASQARFLMLVRNDLPSHVCKEDNNFRMLSQLMLGMRNISAVNSVDNVVVNSLLAYQMASDKALVVRALDSLLSKLPKYSGISFKKKKIKNLSARSIEIIVKNILLGSYSLFEELIFLGRRGSRDWVSYVFDIINASGLDDHAVKGDLNRFNKTNVMAISLMSVIKRNDNPFAHENAVLLLIKNVLETPDLLLMDFDLVNCKVSCSDWNKIQSMNEDVKVTLASSDEAIYPLPEWVLETDESLYRLGMLIRSCLLGGIDWSLGTEIDNGKSAYTGIKTSYYKRSLGMVHSPESINGNTSPMSNWISGLLFKLLKWPGGSNHINGMYDWPKKWDVESLKLLVDKRIEHQKNLYCTLTGIPAYIEKVKLDWAIDKKDLKVVMVQSLLPRKQDFSNYGLMLDHSKFRAKHRGHIASIAELILHKIHSQDSVEESCNKSVVDLIVWPELAVHIDDIDILRNLSRKTGAIIYSGLGFLNLDGVPGPNNCAIWIIPGNDDTGRQPTVRLQGKKNMMADEKGSIKPWRPYQFMLELIHPAFPNDKGFILTGSICYDATDIKLNADLKDKSDAYIVSALNQDVSTFDSMVDSLYYHMYQHVVLVNTGEFGGSVAKAPYKERHHKLITHVHGANQVSISSFEMNMFDFRDVGSSYTSGKKVKTQPAGY